MPSNNFFPRRFCVAPMLDWTDQHCRYFLRLMSRHAWLYTEMVTTGAVLRGNSKKHLQFDPKERPLALQLGGSEPSELAECTRLAASEGYDEVNLNVGCPSPRVKKGRFGACLMAEPALVAESVAAMRAAARLPVTVKTRIGIDDQDSYAALCHFIETVAAAGCEIFIIHARKAWLQGLSPKENREVPPLRYDIAQQLVWDFPHLQIILNGGITSLQQAKSHLQHFAGVMLGRAVAQQPYLLGEVDEMIYQSPGPLASRLDVLQAYLPYVARQFALGVPLQRLIRPVFGLFHGMRGGRQWRRYLSENAHIPGADENVLVHAARYIA